MGCNNWGAELLEDDYLEKYNNEHLVYLSADAEEELDKIEEDKIYIIGGLVDHNRLINATKNKALLQNITLKKLPIQNHLQLKTSAVLAINHGSYFIFHFSFFIFHISYFIFHISFFIYLFSFSFFIFHIFI